MSVKLALGGNLPASNVSNGLAAIAEQFVESPDQPVLCIVEIGVNYLKEYPRNGDVQPVLQITHIEPITTKEGKAEAERTLGAAFTARTGEAHRPDPTANQLDIPNDASATEGGVGV